MKRKITHEMLQAIKNQQVRIAAAYGAGRSVLRKLGATEDELEILGYTKEPSHETTN